MEGMDVVKSAIRKCQQTNIFVVFVIIDNPQNKVPNIIHVAGTLLLCKVKKVIFRVGLMSDHFK